MIDLIWFRETDDEGEDMDEIKREAEMQRGCLLRILMLDADFFSIILITLFGICTMLKFILTLQINLITLVFVTRIEL